VKLVALSQRKYGIFRCRTCGKLNLAKTGQKLKTCPYCGARNKLSRRIFLAYASTPEEALKTVRRLKAGKA
jgi:DNA-directed RNA polymerase subunit RPC12/RpoP